MKKKILITLVIFLFLILAGWEVLNAKGVCISEFRVLGERELSDRALVGRKTWQKMTPEERAAKIKENREKYPNCCRVRYKHTGLDRPRYFFEPYRVNFEVYKPEEYPSPHRAYSSEQLVLNACGFGEGRVLKMGLNKQDYINYTESNKKHWEEIGQ